MTYKLLVDDNYHYMDESERYQYGTYDTLTAAVQAAQRIVDDYLASAYQPGMTAEELYRSYTTFGEDPFIVPTDNNSEPSNFSAWRYARERCEQLTMNN